jgi:hypothetical protein
MSIGCPGGTAARSSSKKEPIMSRLFEWKNRDHSGEIDIIVDLEKIYLVRVEKQKDHYYPRLHVRFVDGHEVQNAVPEDVVQPFLSAYRTYLGERE